MDWKWGKDYKIIVIVFFVLLVILSVIIVNLFFVQRMEKLALTQLLENQQIKTNFAASQIQFHIKTVQEELVRLSKSPNREELGLEKCSSLQKEKIPIQGEKTESLLLANHEGKIVGCSSSLLVDYLHLNIKDKDYFIVPKETREPFITALREGSTTKIVVAVPLFESATYTPYPNFLGNFDGVLLSIIELERLHLFYLHPLVNIKESSFVVVNSKTGEVLMQSDTLLQEKNSTELLAFLTDPAFFANPAQGIRNAPGLGESMVTRALFPVGSEQWTVVMITPLRNVGRELQTIKKGQLISLLFVGTVLLGIFSFALYTYRSKEKIQHKLDQATITLEKVGITIQHEGQRYTASDLVLLPRKLYLLKDHEEDLTMDLFISALNQGYVGLGMVREDPREVRKKYNLYKTPFIWLTSHTVEGIPCEKNIDYLFQLIAEFMKKSPKSVILIANLEYLILENGFEKVMKTINAMKDLTALYDSMVLLSLHPHALEEHKVKIIEAVTTDIYHQFGNGKLNLTELEIKILRLINDRNIQNKLVSYKDITAEGSITKPTTRVKIAKLQLLGLVQVEELGRFKSLRITSRGRKVL